MVEFKIKINPVQRLTRIPKILAQAFGFIWVIVPNTKAAALYPENSDLREVIKSLQIIIQDLQLRTESGLEDNERVESRV